MDGHNCSRGCNLFDLDMKLCELKDYPTELNNGYAYYHLSNRSGEELISAASKIYTFMFGGSAHLSIGSKIVSAHFPGNNLLNDSANPFDVMMCAPNGFRQMGYTLAAKLSEQFGLAERLLSSDGVNYRTDGGFILRINPQSHRAWNISDLNSANRTVEALKNIYTSFRKD